MLVGWLPGLTRGSETAAELESAATRGTDPTAPENEHFWRPRTKAVAVLENGLGFFMRNGEVVTHDGWATAHEVPPATFGTLAIYSLDKDALVDVVGSGPGETTEFDGVDSPKTLEAKRDRLDAWKNLSVQLSYHYKDSQRTAAGKLVSVGPEFVVLETDDNSFAVPIAGDLEAAIARSAAADSRFWRCQAARREGQARHGLSPARDYLDS